MVQLQKRSIIALCTSVLLMACVIFFVIGYFSHHYPKEKDTQNHILEQYRKLTKTENPEATKQLVAQVNHENIKGHLKYLSEFPHVSGTIEHFRTGLYVKSVWQKQNLTVKSSYYDVALSLPKNSQFSKFTILDDSKSPYFESQINEKVLSHHENYTNMTRPILSYSPSGTHTSQVIFVNYGSEADYHHIRQIMDSSNDTKDIAFEGKIALIRYGKVGRGKKLVNAAKFGFKAAIVYSDPADNWARSQEPSYPFSWWLPETGVQRGSAKLRQGDPQTPDYPSLKGLYREPLNNLNEVLPPIPGYPVGYGDAFAILKLLGGPNISSYVNGGLNVSYRTGGYFSTFARNYSVKIDVHNEILVKSAENIFGVIQGSIEPDRYVLIGNHRDAWNYGAVDASSGTATLLEVSRVLSQVYRHEKPRRSIMFCSWDAEEQGIMGSWEWVEDRFPQIKDKVVAYINVDIAVRGNYTIRPNSDPMLEDIILKSLKNLPDIHNEHSSMYDRYKDRYLDKGHSITTPISSSDYSVFIQKAGIPVMDVSYIADPVYSSYYPLYHSRYETFYAMEHFIDPTFLSHKEVALWSAEVLRQLADSLVLEYNENKLIRDLMRKYNKTQSPDNWSWNKQPENVTMTELRESAKKIWETMFTTLKMLLVSTEEFIEKTVKPIQKSINEGEIINVIDIRSLNDRRMKTMQMLTDYHGLPGDHTKHNYFYASKSEEMSGIEFPGLSDLLYAATRKGTEENWRAVLKHISALQYHLLSLSYHIGRVL